MNKLHVNIEHSDASVVVRAGEHIITFRWQDTQKPDINAADFAVWLCLPIAMRTGKKLYINGSLTTTTASNAEAASDAWSLLLPRTYQSIKVNSSATREESCAANQKEVDLMFYSGGIDSTFTLLERSSAGHAQDLLTLHGMDYSVANRDGFEKAKLKTNAFAHKLSGQRHFLYCDAYRTYKRLGLSGRLSYVFLLAAAGFLYSNQYRRCVIAADFSYTQQIAAFPIGSSAATNRFFDSGEFQLITHGESETRATKLPRIAGHGDARRSLSLCKDRRIRPENCGRCSKCVRTKLMFIAATGGVPSDIFQDSRAPSRSAYKDLSAQKDVNRVFVADVYTTALRSGHLKKLPWIPSIYDQMVRQPGFLERVLRAVR